MKVWSAWSEANSTSALGLHEWVIYSGKAISVSVSCGLPSGVKVRTSFGRYSPAGIQFEGPMIRFLLGFVMVTLIFISGERACPFDGEIQTSTVVSQVSVSNTKTDRDTLGLTLADGEHCLQSKLWNANPDIVFSLIVLPVTYVDAVASADDTTLPPRHRPPISLT